MKLSRRGLFPLAAVGMLATGTGAEGANLDEHPGIVIRVIRGRDGWSALVPDFDAMNGFWRPGLQIPLKWIPLSEYLALVEKTYDAEG